MVVVVFLEFCVVFWLGVLVHAYAVVEAAVGVRYTCVLYFCGKLGSMFPQKP